MSAVRLQLWLAKAGVASRRRAEEMITAGVVSVNGQVVRVLGTKVDPVSDRVTVRGEAVEAEASAYLLLNKPKGYVTTAKDPDGRPTIFALFPEQGVRLYPVGRLDFNTEGALLLTNDGELAHALMHPSRGVRKVYHAKFQGEVTKDQIQQLREGVDLPPPSGFDEEKQSGPYRPERSAPAEVAFVSHTGRHTWLEVKIHEGKNRQLHRMAAAVGSSLRKLVRVAYGSLTIEGIETGQHRRLTSAEVTALRKLAGLSGQPKDLAPKERVPAKRPSPARSAPPTRSAPPARSASPARSAPPKRGPRPPERKSPGRPKVRGGGK